MQQTSFAASQRKFLATSLSCAANLPWERAEKFHMELFIPKANPEAERLCETPCGNVHRRGLVGRWKKETDPTKYHVLISIQLAVPAAGSVW
jgi:seryl-tRNA synthetase